MRFQNWEIGGFDRDIAAKFYRGGVNPLISVFLASRGICSEEDAAALISDDSIELYDPFLLTGMDKAAARIELAIQNRQSIAVYGDYDVDGMTASTLLAVYLRTKGVNPEIYIPGRLDEGYGLNRQAIDTLRERGAELIITVDCGITAVAEAEYVRKCGLSLVITDHHECKDEIPVADAVVNPKRPDCPYPNKSLAGVGVVFKLICAMERGVPPEQLLRRYGDLVAIGTVADVMPVTGENRVLIRRGLEVLNSNPRPGLRRLIREACSESKRVNTATVGFVLAPRLNAAGRMGQTELSIELLMTENNGEAERLASLLCALNTERRSLEMSILDEAEAILGDTRPDEPIVLAQRDWHQGVMGIVAAKIAERHFLPAIMISIGEDGIGRGSCRSFGQFGMFSALRTCEDLLDSYGGHEMAAGITLEQRNIEPLRQRINDYYRDNINSVPEPKLILDFEVEKPELLSVRNVESLKLLEPFGVSNPPPRMCIRNALLETAAAVGGGKHSRLRIIKAGKILDCIFFTVPPEELGAAEGMLVDLAFEPQINEFRGRAGVQLHVFDIRQHR